MAQNDEKDSEDNRQELVLRKEFLEKVGNDEQLKAKLASFPSKDDRKNYINTQMTEYVKLNMRKIATKKQNDIKNKCNHIISSISSSINPPSPLQHDNDHGNNWEYISPMAEICLDPFHEFINNLTNSLKLFTSNTNINIIKPPIKEFKSSNEKVNNKYNGNWLQLIDVCRARIIYTDYNQLYFILLILAKYNTNCFGFEVVKIINDNYITLYIKPAKKKAINNNIKLEYTSQEQKLLESIKTNINQDEDEEDESDSEDEDENENVSGLPGHICEIQIIHKTQEKMVEKSAQTQDKSTDDIEVKQVDETESYNVTKVESTNITMENTDDQKIGETSPMIVKESSNTDNNEVKTQIGVDKTESYKIETANIKLTPPNNESGYTTLMTTTPNEDEGEFTTTNDDYKKTEDKIEKEIKAKVKREYEPWRPLLYHKLFWVRIIIILIGVFTLFLTMSYMLSFTLEPKLDNFWCGDITIEEIKQHSIENDVQYGIYNECFDISDSIINSNKLWLTETNGYKPVSLGDDAHAITEFSILVIIFMILGIFILYYTIRLFIDIWKYKRGLFKMANKQDFKELKKKKSNDRFSVDSGNWIIVKLVFDAIMILIQSQAILAYNGVAIIKFTDTKYPIYERHWISIFAVFIFLNCVSNSMLWIAYAFKPYLLHGVVFYTIIMSVTGIFDICYAVFPLVISVGNNRGNSSLYSALAMLQIKNELTYAAAALALVFLAYKFYSISTEATNGMIMDFRRLHIDMPPINTNWILKKETIGNRRYRIEYKHKKIIISVISFLFFIYGSIIFGLTTSHFSNAVKYCNRLVNDSNDFYTILEEGHSTITLDYSIYNNEPELFLFDHCLQPIYPFDNTCECKEFYFNYPSDNKSEIKWNSVIEIKENFNISLIDSLEHVMKSFKEIRKLHISGVRDAFSESSNNELVNLGIKRYMEFTSDMFGLDTLEILIIDNVPTIDVVADEIGHLNKLQILSIRDTEIIQLPESIVNVNNLQYFAWSGYGADNEIEMLPPICEFNELKAIRIENTRKITTIPYCMADMNALEIVYLINMPNLNNISLAIFNLANLRELNLELAADLSFDNLIHTIDNSSVTVNAAVNDAVNEDFIFNFNQNAVFKLALSGICNAHSTNSLFEAFFLHLNITDACFKPCEIGVFPFECRPSQWQNGICNPNCNNPTCQWDGGDCTQLCTVPNFWSEFVNGECDPQFNTSACNYDRCECIPNAYFNGISCMQPTPSPTDIPTHTPSISPSQYPTLIITTQYYTTTAIPSNNPTLFPSINPSSFPTLNPSQTPTIKPTLAPLQPGQTRNPTISPTKNPSMIPSIYPTISPTQNPSINPSISPTQNPTTNTPTTYTPTTAPTLKPTQNPSKPGDTASPTTIPTKTPSISPSNNPSINPSFAPSINPSYLPTNAPTTNIPTISPTNIPTNIPTYNPSISPTQSPITSIPTTSTPTSQPTLRPTKDPLQSGATAMPTITPTIYPSKTPSNIPTIDPTLEPTINPTAIPTINPTINPTIIPTINPTIGPTYIPTQTPTTSTPTITPTKHPTTPPTLKPTKNPLLQNDTASPTIQPTIYPSNNPTTTPTTAPTNIPSNNPSISPSINPSNNPTEQPSLYPTITPTTSPTTSNPTNNPSMTPSVTPTTADPSISPTNVPTMTPTIKPTKSPLPVNVTHIPTINPTDNPTIPPTTEPTVFPSDQPTDTPSINPTVYPSISPTKNPTTVNPTTYAPTPSPTPEPISCISKDILKNVSGLYLYELDVITASNVRFDTCAYPNLESVPGVELLNITIEDNNMNVIDSCDKCGDICHDPSQFTTQLNINTYFVRINGIHKLSIYCSEPTTKTPTVSPTDSTYTPSGYPTPNPTTPEPTTPDTPVYNATFKIIYPNTTHWFMPDPSGRFQTSMEINIYDKSNVLAINQICKKCFIFEFRDGNTPWTVIETEDNNDISVSIVKMDNDNDRDTYTVTLTVQSIRRANGGFCTNLNTTNTRLFFPNKMYQIRMKLKAVNSEYKYQSISDVLTVTTNTLPTGGFCVIQNIEKGLSPLQPYNLFCGDWINQNTLEFNALINNVLINKDGFVNDARLLKGIGPAGNVTITYIIKEKQYKGAIRCMPPYKAEFKTVIQTIGNDVKEVEKFIENIGTITNATDFIQNPGTAPVLISVITDLYKSNLASINDTQGIVGGIINTIIGQSNIIKNANKSDNISINGLDISTEITTMVSVTANPDIVDTDTTTVDLAENYLPAIFNVIDIFADTSGNDTESDNGEIEDQLYVIASELQGFINNLDSTLTIKSENIQKKGSIIAKTEDIKSLNKLADTLVDSSLLAASKALSRSAVGESFNYENIQYNIDGSIKSKKVIAATKFSSNPEIFNNPNIDIKDIELPKCGSSNQNIQLPLSFLQLKSGIFDCSLASSNTNNFLSTSETQNENRTQNSDIVSINIYSGDKNTRRRLLTDKISHKSDDCFPYLITIELEDPDIYNIDINKFELGDSNPYPSCDFWDVKDEFWDTKGCFVYDVTESSVICGCTHLTTFSIAGQDIIPSATILTELDWRNLTFKNIINNPTVSIALLLVFTFIMIICCIDPRSSAIDTPSIIAFEDSIYKSFQKEKLYEDIVGKEMKIIDDHLPNKHAVGGGLRSLVKGDKNSGINEQHAEGICLFQVRLWLQYVRNDHTLISLFSRTSGTNLTLRQRLGCFFMYLCTVMIATGMFYGETQSYPAADIVASFFISLFGTLPSLITKKVFEKSKPIEVKSQREAMYKMTAILGGNFTPQVDDKIDNNNDNDYSDISDDDGEHEHEDLRLIATKAGVDRFGTMKEFNEQIGDLYEQTNEEKIIRAKHIRKALFDQMFPLPNKFKKLAWIILIIWTTIAALSAIVYGLKFDLQFEQKDSDNFLKDERYKQPCWNNTMELRLEVKQSLKLADDKQSALDSTNAETYGGTQAKSWILSIFQSLIMSLIIWQPLTIYIVTWIKIWAFTWHLKMKVGPGNIIALCKRCCCPNNNNNNGQQIEDMSAIDLIAHDYRPIEPHSFLGHKQLIIDDEKNIDIIGQKDDDEKDGIELQNIEKIYNKKEEKKEEKEEEKEEKEEEQKIDDDEKEEEEENNNDNNDNNDIDEQPPDLFLQTTIDMANEFVEDYMKTQTSPLGNDENNSGSDTAYSIEDSEQEVPINNNNIENNNNNNNNKPKLENALSDASMLDEMAAMIADEVVLET